MLSTYAPGIKCALDNFFYQLRGTRILGDKYTLLQAFLHMLGLLQARKSVVNVTVVFYERMFALLQQTCIFTGYTVSYACNASH